MNLNTNNPLTPPFFNKKKKSFRKLPQGNQKFGDTERIQCVSHSFFSYLFSAIESVSIWKSSDLNYTIAHGNHLISNLKVAQPLAVNDLPSSVNVLGC